MVNESLRLQVLDARTGAIIAKYLPNQVRLHDAKFSKDGRYFAAEGLKWNVAEDRAEVPIGQLLLVDLTQGKTHELLLPSASQDGKLHFSNTGETLVWVRGNSLRIYDTASARLLDERESVGMMDPPVFTDRWLVHLTPTSTDHPNIEVWSPRAQRLLVKLQNVAAGNFGRPDSPFLVYAKWKGDGKKFDKYAIWNLHANRLEAEYQPEEFIGGPRLFTPDGCFTACDYAQLEKEQQDYVEVRELATWKQVAKAMMLSMSEPFLSTDGRFLALTARDADPEKQTVTMLEMPTLKELWKHKGVEFGRENPFNHDSSAILVIAINGPEVLVYDTATGKRRARISWPLDRQANNLHLRMTPDRRFLLLNQVDQHREPAPFWARWLQWIGLNQFKLRNDIVVVLDLDTCEERIRLQGWGVEHAVLADDGLTLATVHEQQADLRHMLRCWDVNAWKPLHWAIGVPAGLAAVIGLFAWWRERRGVKVAYQQAKQRHSVR